MVDNDKKTDLQANLAVNIDQNSLYSEAKSYNYINHKQVEFIPGFKFGLTLENL